MVSLPKIRKPKGPPKKKVAKRTTKKVAKKGPKKEKRAYRSPPGQNSDFLSLTEEKIAEMCRIVEAGNFRYVAAQRMGIPKNTYSSWMTRGKKELRDFAAGKVDTLTIKATLVRELDKAEARCHVLLLQDVITSESIQAKMWFLERRYNKLYSKNPNARIDDSTGTEVKVDALELLADKLRSLLES